MAIQLPFFNRSKEKTEDVIACHPDKKLCANYDIEKLRKLYQNHVVSCSMVQAGPGADATIQALLPHLDKGDILIDGGNTFYKVTIRRNENWRTRGLTLSVQVYLVGKKRCP